MTSLTRALRTLRSAPIVTAVAVLSLALGIGANTAIFSLVDRLLLRPLPVRDPGALVNLGAPGPKPGATSCNRAGDCEQLFSYPMFRDLERAQTAFTGLAAHRAFDANVGYQGRTTRTAGEFVSGAYFPVLGLTPAFGRLLDPSDDRAIGASPVVVVSYAYWEATLGRDPSVLDRTILVGDQPLTIVGVAPRGFAGTTLGDQPALFVPITMRGRLSPGGASNNGPDDRRSYWVYAFARLKPGVSRVQAARTLNAVYRPILTDVETSLQQGMTAPELARFTRKVVTLDDGARGQSSMPGEARTPLRLLFAVTGAVLLIACANIANLLLARGANRAGEMALCLSLGARRSQLVAQLLLESVVLAALGGAVSLLVARWTLAGVGSLLTVDTARTVPPQLDGPVVLFTGGVALLTGLLFGIVPALHSTRPGLIGVVRASAGHLSSGTGARRFRTALVTAQIALSMTLLVGAALLLRSLVNVSRVDLGFRPADVVTFGIVPERNGYTGARSAAFFAQATQALAAIPGVTGVSAATVPIVGGITWYNNVSVDGVAAAPAGGEQPGARFNEIGAGYFRTLGAPLLAGREFTSADDRAGPKVAIVNEAFAKAFGLGRHAVGRRMGTGDRAAREQLDIEIVGVVADTKYSGVKDGPEPLFFRPYAQDSTVSALHFYVRSAVGTAPVLRAVPGTVARLDPTLSLEDLKPLREQVRESTSLDRMIGTLSVAFALLATLLAAVGLYGVLAYTVAQRTREIGVRIALGASQHEVRRLVLRQVMRMTLVGGTIGFAAALVLGVAARSILFGVAAWDPIAFALPAVFLAAVAGGAGYLPARRAARIEPVRALRTG